MSAPREDFVNKRRVGVATFLVLFGLMPLFNSFSNPRLQNLHGVDRLQLIAVGLCFGVAFGLLVGGRAASK